MIPLEDTGTTRNVPFVIQEHKAKKAGRHFDLRLVIKGKSVSWAIPMKGKRDHLSRMPNPGEKWAAIRQPDHIVEYNEFEGHIPKGQKGHGDVKIWAAGLCDIDKIEGKEVHFRIYDGPARGKYTLVETKNGGLIISSKEKPVEVWTKPSYTKKQEAHLDELERKGKYVAERKVDGASVELRVVGEDLPRLRTYSHRRSVRTGMLVEHTARLDHLDGANTAGLGGTHLRAEAWHPRGVNFLSGTLNSGVMRAREVQRSAGPVRLDVFDVTRYRDQDVTSLPYSERRAIYEDVCRRLNSPYVKPVRSVKSGFNRFYVQQVNLKKAPTDGIVLKEMAAPYPGASRLGNAVAGQETLVGNHLSPVRSTSVGPVSNVSEVGVGPSWIKVKPSDLADVEVVGLTEGRGKYAGSLGALTVETPEGGRVQIGSGFTDWERSWIWQHRDEIPGEVARAEFHVRGGDRTNTGPRFHSWHPDKSESALGMYADAMGVDKYALKSAAGWKRTA